ncbi:hypothetical protein OVY01_10250 [Robbsia sp. Bb-Pol-6]|uniref:F-box domain-containing protein n=1 Tax=Robbsia betulipollinis TaxID=2981849 RepID=A0ABT3ZM24_9BURK|nr:hypothetical protein [Robbsia betulipollinis]MCY0387606.1 hypothetical protein [Robbsia betulipollinis]
MPLLPSEILSRIATHLEGREVLAFGNTAKSIYPAISGEIDSARLAAHTTRTTGTRKTDTGALARLLGNDAPPAPPTSLHPRGRPNTITGLRDSLRDAPYAAAARVLEDQASTLHEGEAIDQIQAYSHIRVAMAAVPVGHRLPILEVLASGVSKLPTPINAEAHDHLLDEVLGQPLDRQSKALKRLASGLQKLTEPQRFERFERFVSAIGAHPSRARADLLQELLPVIRNLPAATRLQACRVMLGAMETLSADHRDGHRRMKDLCHGMCHYVMTDTAPPDQDTLLRSLARLIARVPDYPIDTMIRHLSMPERARVREAIQVARKDSGDRRTGRA